MKIIENGKEYYVQKKEDGKLIKWEIIPKKKLKGLKITMNKKS